MQNLAYLNQNTDIKIPHGLADHIICSDTIKITFVIGIELTEKISGIVNNAGIELVKKMIPIKRNWYNQQHRYCKDLHLSKKECEEKLIQDIQ